MSGGYYDEMIPDDPRRVFLLVHPDKCPMPEATDATAILNKQRPPGSSILGGGSTARVELLREGAEVMQTIRKTDPEDGLSYSLEELRGKMAAPPLSCTEEEILRYWSDRCTPAPGGFLRPGLERRIDPEDQNAYSFEELRAKYQQTYAESEIREYWEEECSRPSDPWC